MAFTTESMNKVAPEEAPTGEMRLDEEGKGYWHSFKNDKKPVKVEEPKKEVAVIPKKEVQAPINEKK